MEILRVENLVKTYGKGENQVNAVDDISLSVEKGEFVAIVGASGSGKSTLLHLIGGVDRPTSGKIFIDGNDITKMNSDTLAICRIFSRDSTRAEIVMKTASESDLRLQRQSLKKAEEVSTQTQSKVRERNSRLRYSAKELLTELILLCRSVFRKMKLSGKYS